MSSVVVEQLLAEEDVVHLREKGYQFDVDQVGGFVHVVIKSFPLPTGYSPSAVDLLLRLPPSFPMAKPDMFWMFPHVKLASGSYPDRADQFDVNYQDRQWQRWSRHFTDGYWRAGTDNLKTYLGTIWQELRKGV